MKQTILILLPILVAIPEVLGCYLPAKRSGSTCDELQPYLVGREQWCAEEPSGTMECMRGPVRYVIIHHTVSRACSTNRACSEEMKKLQRDHMTKNKWPDVGYHYVIGGDVRAYVGRPCNKMGGHTKDHNRKSIGIAFFGDYQEDSPSPEMLDLVPKISYCAVEQGYLHPHFLVVGHRDAFCSTCPGDALYEVVKKWPRYPDKVPVPSYTCDAPQTTTEAEMTTTCSSVPTTTSTTTTTPSTTTTEATTTTTTTTATSTMDAGSTPEVARPVYVYFLLSQKHSPCCLH